MGSAIELLCQRKVPAYEWKMDRSGERLAFLGSALKRDRAPASAISDHETEPNRVRDRLGLVHHENGTPLVSLYLSGETIKGRKHARPTFADAGGHRRFKTVFDLACNKRRKCWGFTTDLYKLKTGMRSIDGAMERVVESIPTDVSPEFNYWIIGFVSNTRGLERSDNDEAFAKRLMARRSCKGLEKELLALL